MTEAQMTFGAMRYIVYGVAGLAWGWGVYQIVLFFQSKKP